MHIMTEVFNVAHQQRFELLRLSVVSLQQHGKESLLNSNL